MSVNIIAMDCHLTNLTGSQLTTLIINHRNPMPKAGPTPTSGQHGPALKRISDHFVYLGLAEHLIDRYSQALSAAMGH